VTHTTLAANIAARLKAGPEQQRVVGPVVERLCRQGWTLDQMRFGKTEWQVPKSPSEQTKREKRQHFAGFPVDIAVFDGDDTTGDPQHLLFVIECKQPNETAGVAQLEAYFIGEPRCRLGVWANNADPAASSVFLYRKPDGGMLVKKKHVADLPAPGERIEPAAQRITFRDLIIPPESTLRRTVEDLLDEIVANDSRVTRREDQLDQLCNLLLLKLESDKEGKANPAKPVFFRALESERKTADAIRRRYTQFVDLYPETFTTTQDKELRLIDSTIARCVDELSGLRLVDVAVSTVAVAFQVLRAEALKQGEGQYFTPQEVIHAGVRLLDVKWEDIVIDPACGTGGFLIETMLEMKRKNPGMAGSELARWAQTHVHGLEKDSIGLKTTKAIMQIAGDGSAHCARADAVRTHLWSREFPHLAGPTFADGRFSVVVTNPPFGKKLRVSAQDARLARYTIAKDEAGNYVSREIGLIFLERAYRLVGIGGRIGIVLPETYFFSRDYLFLFKWLKSRLHPLVVANVPMEAFQGFCRAKTNFYVFEKIAEVDSDVTAEM
jgi:type I restriction enzyme M protein